MSVLDEIRKAHKELCEVLAEFSKVKLSSVILFDYDARKDFKTDVVEKTGRKVQSKCFLMDQYMQVLLNALWEACDGDTAKMEQAVAKCWARIRLTPEEEALRNKRQMEERDAQIAENKKTGKVPGQGKLFKDDGSVAEEASPVTTKKLDEVEPEKGKGKVSKASGKDGGGKETTSTSETSTTSTSETSTKAPQEIIDAGKPQTAMEKAFQKAEAKNKDGGTLPAEAVAPLQAPSPPPPASVGATEAATESTPQSKEEAANPKQSASFVPPPLPTEPSGAQDAKADTSPPSPKPGKTPAKPATASKPTAPPLSVVPSSAATAPAKSKAK